MTMTAYKSALGFAVFVLAGCTCASLPPTLQADCAALCKQNGGVESVEVTGISAVIIPDMNPSYTCTCTNGLRKTQRKSK